MCDHDNQDVYVEASVMIQAFSTGVASKPAQSLIGSLCVSGTQKLLIMTKQYSGHGRRHRCHPDSHRLRIRDWAGLKLLQ